MVGQAHSRLCRAWVRGYMPHIPCVSPVGFAVAAAKRPSPSRRNATPRGLRCLPPLNRYCTGLLTCYTPHRILLSLSCPGCRAVARRSAGPTGGRLRPSLEANCQPLVRAPEAVIPGTPGGCTAGGGEGEGIPYWCWCHARVLLHCVLPALGTAAHGPPAAPWPPGIVAHEVLTDRRHVLTRDSEGVVALWDVLTGCQVETYGKVRRYGVRQGPGSTQE